MAYHAMEKSQMDGCKDTLHTMQKKIIANHAIKKIQNARLQRHTHLFLQNGGQEEHRMNSEVVDGTRLTWFGALNPQP